MGSLLPGLKLSDSALDRDAVHRDDHKYLQQAVSADQNQIVLVADGQVAVSACGTKLATITGPVRQLAEQDPVYLGLVDQQPVFAVWLPTVPDVGHSAQWVSLRAAAVSLVGPLAQCAATAVALAHWHRSHQYCGHCGTATVSKSAGWLRVCPHCGAQHYPRTDAAVIMLVVDADDRLLLARNPRWPTGRMSLLAGFLEPGESLSDAVRREVHEEVGVQVADVAYVASQSWPFPSSLMVGFWARATTTDITVDGTEVSVAQWFTRAEYQTQLAAQNATPERQLSISTHMINLWLTTKSALPV